MIGTRRCPARRPHFHAVAMALVVAGAPFRAEAADNSSPQQRRNSIAGLAHKQLVDSCSKAQAKSDDTLREYAVLADREIAIIVAAEREFRQNWQRARAEAAQRRDAESARLAAAARREYLFWLAMATRNIEIMSWFKLVCLTGRNAPTIAATGVTNQCETTSGPLQCSGAFVGAYTSNCSGENVSAVEQGTGRLTVRPDGSLSLVLTTRQGQPAGEIEGKLLAGGDVAMFRTRPDSPDLYSARFAVTTSTAGARTLTGGGKTITKGAGFRCDGAFSLAR